MKYDKFVDGKNPQGNAMRFETGAPLDDRTCVKYKKSLIAKSAFKDITWIFKGMMTAVQETGEIYVLKVTPGDTKGDGTKHKMILYTDAELDAMSNTDAQNAIDNYWTKIPSQTDLETNKKDLFSFQGVASAIDADHCTLTIGNPTLSGVTYKVWTYRVDVEGDTYMFWADASAKTQPTIGYWLRDPFQNGSMTYTLSSSKANILIYNSEKYYETGTVVNDRTQYLSLDGKDIWVNGSDVYETSDSTTPLTTQSGKAETHDVYFFTEATKLTDVTQASGTGNAVQALPSNKGHVYQLGEEEYASNGTIWVQLGSPKEDWIVIK